MHQIYYTGGMRFFPPHQAEPAIKYASFFTGTWKHPIKEVYVDGSVDGIGALYELQTLNLHITPRLSL